MIGTQPTKAGQTTVWTHTLEALPIQPDPNLYNWLVKPYILSHALRKVTDDLKLELVHQGIDTIFSEERPYLDDPNSDQGLVRKIRLYSDKQSFIYARTVIPNSTYQSLLPELSSLGQSFIGESLLYNRTDVLRDPFEYAMMKPEHPMRQELKQIINHTDQYSVLWARRSCFWIKQHPLLITELYLYGYPEYPAEKK